MMAATLLPVSPGGGTLAPSQGRKGHRPVQRRGRVGEPIRVGEMLLHIAAFETRRKGEALTVPPRTVGHACMVAVGGSRGLAAVGDRQAVAVARLRCNDPAPAGAARGKVVFGGSRGETLVYQADQEQHSAALCACGNATGAAAALQAQWLGRRRIRQTVKLPDGWVEANATVSPAGKGAWRIEQTWGGVQLAVRQAQLCGREVAVCTGTFNEYLLVRLPRMAEFEAFALQDARALWRAGQAFGAFQDPLRTRLAAVTPDGPCAGVKFFTCGRTHPGAPLTGLALLAAAADRIDWLADAVAGGPVAHGRGVDTLPAARATSRGAEIRFPTIDVILHDIV